MKFVLPAGVLILLVVLGVFLMGKSESSLSGQNFEVLETLDANGVVPRFKLNVQSHGDSELSPQKVILIQKSDHQKILDLPLTSSQNPVECANHSAMLDSMKKWDTNWFSVDKITAVSDSYDSKLNKDYEVEVVGKEESTRTEMRIFPVSGVCYQVSKAVKSIPNPDEESEEEE